MKSANFSQRWRVALAAAVGLGSSYVAMADQTKSYEWLEPGGAVSYSQSSPATSHRSQDAGSILATVARDRMLNTCASAFGPASFPRQKTS